MQWIKAKYFAKKYQMPAISDDSGLCVNALMENQAFIQKDIQTVMIMTIMLNY